MGDEVTDISGPWFGYGLPIRAKLKRKGDSLALPWDVGAETVSLALIQSRNGDVGLVFDDMRFEFSAAQWFRISCLLTRLKARVEGEEFSMCLTDEEAAEFKSLGIDVFSREYHRGEY